MRALYKLSAIVMHLLQSMLCRINPTIQYGGSIQQYNCIILFSIGFHDEDWINNKLAIPPVLWLMRKIRNIKYDDVPLDDIIKLYIVFNVFLILC